MIGLQDKWIELDIPFYRTAACQRSFLYRATKLWNNIKDIAQVLEFFKKLVRERVQVEC